MERFYFDDAGRFAIEDYSSLSPFSSFLPGIAGLMGIPMWVFYVNRGQAIAGFGVESKDTPIMEFQPANRAYQLAPYLGFRTFVKASGTFYEPFSALERTRARRMLIGANELELQESADEIGLRVSVLYFTLTDEPFAGLVRRVTIENTSGEALDLEVLDGLPAIIPFGMNNWLLKEIGRTAEAWMGVFNVENDIPFYRLSYSIVDKVEVEGYHAGHFYTTFTADRRLPALVDPRAVFGQNTALSYPDAFLDGSLDALYAQKQITVGRTPCGFFGAGQTLQPGESFTLYGLIGHVSDVDEINCEAERLSSPAYIEEKFQSARELARSLTDVVAIRTSEPLLDEYTRQSFLDNVLRGGWPVLLGHPARPVVQHVYSRKHGDLERDYNAFYLAPEFYSQGNGSYRDVNQNRREDVWLNPRVGDYNIVTFMNLIQADGYNPLIIRGNRFTVSADERDAVLSLVENPSALENVLAHPFTPGELLKTVQVSGVRLRTDPQTFLSEVLDRAEQRFEAAFGEGYWVDHWTYNLDLIENYLSIYPERRRKLLFERPVFTYYDSPVTVRPRDEKTVLANGQVRQLDAIHEDEEKAARIASREEQPNVMRLNGGQGDVYQTTLFNKLVVLTLLKFTTLDPLGIGIEMEAGRPGWYDALNGLPGLFGSSVPETFELQRLITFLRGSITRSQEPFNLPVEVMDLLDFVVASLHDYFASSEPDRDMICWDAVSSAREVYRERIRFGFSGKCHALSLPQLDRVLALFLDKLALGINRAFELNNGIPPTYLSFRPVEYDVIRTEGSRQYVQVKQFEASVLPLFLEGPVRALRVAPTPDAARALHQRVKSSALFDQKLKMYKVNASLAEQPPDIGRTRAFTPGWLENEFIWLHMEYKYLLALLDAGLFEEFYADFRHVLIPFQDPAVYGRSPLENSSFLVSSAHPDANLHGQGFVARLSGSTVEYLSILHRIMFGREPFAAQNGRLTLTLRPALPGWLFDDQDTVTCRFLGTCTVVYHNPDRRDTFGDGAVQPIAIGLKTADGETVEIAGSIVPEPYASAVRDGKIVKMQISLR